MSLHDRIAEGVKIVGPTVTKSQLRGGICECHVGLSRFARLRATAQSFALSLTSKGATRIELREPAESSVRTRPRPLSSGVCVAYVSTDLTTMRAKIRPDASGLVAIKELLQAQGVNRRKSQQTLAMPPKCQPPG